MPRLTHLIPMHYKVYEVAKKCGYTTIPDLHRSEFKFGHMMTEYAILFRNYRDVNLKLNLILWSVSIRSKFVLYNWKHFNKSHMQTIMMEKPALALQTPITVVTHSDSVLITVKERSLYGGKLWLLSLYSKEGYLRRVCVFLKGDHWPHTFLLAVLGPAEGKNAWHSSGFALLPAAVCSGWGTVIKQQEKQFCAKI